MNNRQNKKDEAGGVLDRMRADFLKASAFEMQVQRNANELKRIAERLRERANGTSNPIDVASELKRADELLEDCHRVLGRLAEYAEATPIEIEDGLED